MPDRIAEIRARLDAAKQEMVCSLLFGQMEQTAAQDFISSAPADIAWLLDEVERLRGLAACPDCDYMDGGKPCVYCAAAHKKGAA